MRWVRVFLVICAGYLAACAAPPEGSTDGNNEPEIAALTKAIMDLGPNVDPVEAAQAARLAYDYTEVLRVQYEITDPPLIHNTKVNAGIKTRGLCWHWATDIEARMNLEGYETLMMHRAIANDQHPILISHSTAIIGAAGSEWDEGIVLDPWRYGGVLFWDEVVDDDRYPWEEKFAVLAARPPEDR